MEASHSDVCRRTWLIAGTLRKKFYANQQRSPSNMMDMFRDYPARE